jgi:hypothetical protein
VISCGRSSWWNAGDPIGGLFFPGDPDEEADAGGLVSGAQRTLEPDSIATFIWIFRRRIPRDHGLGSELVAGASH